MKTCALTLVFLSFISHNLYPQVGIGTTTPNALLDVRASNPAAPSNQDGILIPKVDEFPLTPPTALQDGMLLYATGNGSVSKGFYFWDSSISNWAPIGYGSSWLLSGNSGTNPGTDFIGTTDAQDLEFRTNNISRIVLTQRGQLQFLNTGRSIFIGELAGNADDFTNNDNVAIGYNSLPINVTGSQNTAIGVNTMVDRTSGNYNVAVGEAALFRNISGERNVAVGHAALFGNLIGSRNVVVGDEAFNLGRGSENTVIGYNAGYGSTGTISGSVLIGSFAGRGATPLSNKLHIANVAYTTKPSLIYGEFDNNFVQINGNLRVTGTAINTVNGTDVSLYSTNTTATNVGASATDNFSIIADSNIAATGFYAYSDERIKNIIGPSNSSQDLDLLNKIQVTDYTMKDHIAYGNTKVKKIIAQQVKNVIPEIVSKTRQFIPDIYQMASVNNQWIHLKCNVKTGDKVKLLIEDATYVAEVLEVGPDGFKVNYNQDKNVFVYGTEVDDFNLVDYEALTTLNISATQELFKKIQNLEQQLNALTKTNADTQHSLHLVLEKLEQLEAKTENHQ